MIAYTVSLRFSQTFARDLSMVSICCLYNKRRILLLPELDINVALFLLDESQCYDFLALFDPDKHGLSWVDSYWSDWSTDL